MRPHPTPRSALSVAAFVLLALVCSLAWSSPAAAHGDKDRPELQRLELASLPDLPLVTSPHVRHLSTNPG